MTDGLYLNNAWVADVDLPLTFQVNDLTKPDSIQTTYSGNINLPDTLLIRDLFENAEQIDAGGLHPYQLLTAKVIEEGEVIFSGQARLQTFKGGWNVNLFEATRSLFDTLGDKSLRDLDLGRFDHLWTLDKITKLAGSTSGVVYPVIDYGAYDEGTFADDALFPAVYAHTLIQQMLLESGFRVAGTWLQDDLIKRIAVPFVDDQANNQDDDWVTARKARVTVGPPSANQLPFYLNKNIDFNPVPYSVDNKSDDYWFDGSKDNFKPALHAYVCDVAMRLHVQAYQKFACKVDFGAVEATLQVMKNGTMVVQQYFSVSGPHNISGTGTEELKLDEFIPCQAGDQITIRFTYDHRTLISSASQTIWLDPEHSYVSFTPDNNILPGDTWVVARNLPSDITCADLLLTIALMTSSTYQVDNLRKTLRLIPLDDVVANTANAVDWSTRVEELEEPELSVTLEPYGQRNNLRWKELDFVSELATSASSSQTKSTRNPAVTSFGDGAINAIASNLPAITDLFELAFSACQNSDKSLSAYGNPVLIRTRRISGTGSDRTVDRQSTTARLILIEPTAIVNVQASTITPEYTIQKNPVSLTGCWWAMRPPSVKTTDNALSLAFDRVSELQREQTLIVRCFNGLKRVLRRPRSLAISLYLHPEDIATLDLTRPIQLKQVRAGSLVINNNYLYLNSIENYVGSNPCIVHLVPYY